MGRRLVRVADTNLAGYESLAGAIEGMDVPPELNRLDHKDDERIRGLARKLDVDPDAVEETQPTEAEVVAVQLERVPVPAWLRKAHHGSLRARCASLLFQHGVHAPARRSFECVTNSASGS
jgi:hypothetical protein